MVVVRVGFIQRIAQQVPRGQQVPLVAGLLVFGLLGCDGADEPGDAQALTIEIHNRTPSVSVYATGTFDTPDTGVEPGPLEPGQSYRIDVTAHPGTQVQIVTMFLESNDAFLAFAPGGISLWSLDGEPLVGDRSDELVLYDAGSEANEALGFGPNQAPRQPDGGVGIRQGGVVRVLGKGDSGAGGGQPTDLEGVEFPAVAEFAQLHVVHRGGAEFQLVLTNVSGKGLLEPPEPPEPPNQPKQGDGRPARLSPGIYSVHGPEVAWFAIAEPITPALEPLVEDGDPSAMAAVIDHALGVASDLSPVVWIVHDGQLELDLCRRGAPASAGIEDLAEDGRTETLLAELTGPADVGPGALARGPGLDAGHVLELGVAARDGSSVIEPGRGVAFEVHARPGDRLSFVAGYLAANDKLVGACGAGIPLFDADGRARLGELGVAASWAVDLLDAGTELDEPPGVGPSQFERQPRAGAGVDENDVVREVRGEWMGWVYPATDSILGVELELASGDRSVHATP